jgi:hypothetical protein
MANDLTFVIRWSIEASVRLIGIVAYLFYRNWALAAVACAVIPVCAWINRQYGRWLHENAKKVQTALAEVCYAGHTVHGFVCHLELFLFLCCWVL